MKTAITTQETNFYNVTEKQINSVVRCVDPDSGQVSYEVQSQSDPETRYLVGWNKRFSRWQCMPLTGAVCGASAQGVPCWHLRASAAVESMEQDAQASERYIAAREAKAIKRDGDLAYTRKPFSLLAS